MNLEQKYDEWLLYADNDVKTELISHSDDKKAIEDRFYKDLSFGTGGMRGKLGAGTNRMNLYSVGRITFGLLDYLIKKEAKKIVIAFDSRKQSREFADRIAEIASSKDINAYVFEKVMPTPVLSYTVRKLNADAGIVITASHNPKEYNGYKVYNEKGCQITDETASKVSAEINKYGYFTKYIAEKSLIHKLDDKFLNDFIEEIMQFSLPYERKYLPSIVYTPLNGTGKDAVCRLFSKLGFDNYSIVPEQSEPNEEFTTCPSPNPEEKTALNLAVEMAKRSGAELVIATDPDADRVGLAVKDENNEYRLLNGNETGVLMENFILSVKAQNKSFLTNPYIVKTVVTTPLADKIAQTYGVEVKTVLTGFKYIGEAIDKYKSSEYVFGMEESFGYLVGTHARDKDSISAIMIIVEAVCYYKSTGYNLIQALERIYQKYGYYSTALYSKCFEGQSGMNYMLNFMNKLREQPFKKICGKNVISVKDYFYGIEGLPKSNVIELSGAEFSLIVRPSGTEPKIKFYMTAKANSERAAGELIEKMTNFISKIV